PTDMLELPPAITWGLILIHTGTVGCFAPNCSNIDKLSILICAPRADTSSISSRDTPLGVNIISSGLKPASNPNCTSCKETVSNPLPKLLNNFRMDIFDNALQA